MFFDVFVCTTWLAFIGVRRVDDSFDVMWLRAANERFFYDPIGNNNMCRFVTNQCKDTSFDINFHNHSLRATVASTIYNAIFEEQVVKHITGHILIDVLV